MAPSWLIAQILGTIILAAAFALAEEPSPWIWACYAACMISWLIFAFLEPWYPRVATTMLGISAVVAAAVAGPANDATAVVTACVLLGRYMSLVLPSGYTLLGVFGTCLTATAVSTIVTGHSTTALASYLVLIVLVTLLGLNQRQQQLRAEQAEELLVQRELAQEQQVRAAALDERARIARELHDVLAHSLGTLSVQIKLAEALLEQDDQEGALATVRKSNQLAQDGMEEAHNAVSALRADVPALPDALTDLVEQHRHHHGEVDLAIVGDSRPIPPAAALSLLRATREALTNTAKHAPGETVTVRLEFAEKAVRIVVRNPVPAASPSGRSSGHGLTGMRERLALVHGTIEAGKQADGHWQVTAEVPE
ncbi:sensor histidine kinase [Kutzneria kofuensis]|uniref:histidine kinase n=1 Tax=Kutzneria kofuensis TaxID=103725 RepID=A0A7W9KF93_9PSEU|nr:sensor histidine kinase [Kutzneria kofuensis]MBB5891342.1 signal transduction histidine kinase [Kutzneria kofuensis]